MVELRLEISLLVLVFVGLMLMDWLCTLEATAKYNSCVQLDLIISCVQMEELSMDMLEAVHALV